VVTSAGSEIPVVRGWLADVRAAPPPPHGPAALVGLLQPPNQSGPPDDNVGDDVIPELSITDLLQRTPRDLYGGYVVATARPVPGSSTPATGSAGLAAASAEQLPGPRPRPACATCSTPSSGGSSARSRSSCGGAGSPRTSSAGGRHRAPDSLGSVSKLFPAYRVLAILVGVLLAFCSLVAMPLKYLAADGTSLQHFGEQASIMWVAHGWVFIVYVVVSFLLWRQTRWSLPFALLVLVSGLIPLVIFYVERVVTRRIRAEHPELAATPG
jgi:integral membrane protein